MTLFFAGLLAGWLTTGLILGAALAVISWRDRVPPRRAHEGRAAAPPLPAARPHLHTTPNTPRSSSARALRRGRRLACR